MRLIYIVYLSLFVSTCFAEAEMNEEQMELQAKKIEECFSKIDPSSFDALQKKGEAMQEEIRSLCAAGKRDEAMDVGMKYGKEISTSPEMKELHECSKLMQSMMGNMPKPYMPPSVVESGDGGHICDDM